MFNIVNTVPIAVITDPSDGASYFESQAINLRGFAFDPDETIPATDMKWSSDISGALGSGSDIWVTLPVGSHTITFTAGDSFGSTGSDDIEVDVLAGAGYPTARITAPGDRAVFATGTTITFVGSGSDPEDGPLTGTALQWSSDIDGPLGSGASVNAVLSGPSCGTRVHTVRLVATDSDGKTGVHSIEVTVGRIC